MRLIFSNFRRPAGANFTARAGFRLLVALLLAGWLLLPGQSTAQTTPTPEVTTGPTGAPNQASGATSDYLSESLRLLFPAAPASLDWNNLESPIFSSDTPTFDLVSLGILKSSSAEPLTKSFTLDLGGGVRGRIFAQPPWLQPVPDRFINGSGNGRLEIKLNLRRDPGQGAGLLPGQTNWGHLLLSLNGTLFDYAVPLIAEAPAAIKREDGDKVFALQKEIADRLDGLGDLDAFIGSPAYPNASQTALGLAVDYLGESEYNQRLARADFTDRVAEMLGQKDYNGDGWIGFKPEDILLGAPGWALGHEAPKK